MLVEMKLVYLPSNQAECYLDRYYLITMVVGVEWGGRYCGFVQSSDSLVSSRTIIKNVLVVTMPSLYSIIVYISTAFLKLSI